MSNEHQSHSTIQAVGDVATGVVNGLKNQPMMLSLVVLQICVLGVVVYSSMNRQAAYSEQFKALYDLLQSCLKAGR